MKPGTKFAIGATVIVGSVALMIVEGIRTTGTYFLTPTQLITRVDRDPHYHNIGLKVSAKVVPGSIRRDLADQRIDFSISDGTQTFPVTIPARRPTFPTHSPMRTTSTSWSMASSAVTACSTPPT